MARSAAPLLTHPVVVTTVKVLPTTAGEVPPHPPSRCRIYTPTLSTSGYHLGASSRYRTAGLLRCTRTPVVPRWRASRRHLSNWTLTTSWMVCSSITAPVCMSRIQPIAYLHSLSDAFACPHGLAVPQKAFEKMPEAYFKATGAPKPMQDRTPTQKIQFNIAMWESASAHSLNRRRQFSLSLSEPHLKRSLLVCASDAALRLL